MSYCILTDPPPQQDSEADSESSESHHAGILEIPIEKCFPSPENDKLYKPIDPTSADIAELAKSIAADGVLEPIVITLDHIVLSGHRRLAASIRAGLKTIPCRMINVWRRNDIDGFVKLLREYNRQRDKTHDERLRECMVDADPAEIYDQLQEYKRKSLQVKSEPIEIVGTKSRAAISKAKLPLLTAVQKIIRDLRELWPLTDRLIHYQLLNDPPLCHASKPDSTYTNTATDYQNQLVDILTRARICGMIPMEAIGDTERAVAVWDVHAENRGFITDQIGGFLQGYSRDLMQSQAVHIELVGEKNTLQQILRPVAAEYTIPMTLGKGYCSIPPRWQMVQRFKKSGKAKLVLLMLGDHDPDGDEIVHSFARSIRDDFEVTNIHPIRVAITPAQISRHKLVARMTAKETSTHHDKFVAKNL